MEFSELRWGSSGGSDCEIHAPRPDLGRSFNRKFDSSISSILAPLFVVDTLTFLIASPLSIPSLVFSYRLFILYHQPFTVHRVTLF